MDTFRKVDLSGIEVYANIVSITKKQNGKMNPEYYLNLSLSGSQKDGGINSSKMIEMSIPINQSLYDKINKTLDESKAGMHCWLSAKGNLEFELMERN
ncbi:MAG: hypothetical protein AABW67_00260 [Nanoarchaeota archaeon]